MKTNLTHAACAFALSLVALMANAAEGSAYDTFNPGAGNMVWSAAKSSEQLVREAVVDGLKDPDSAKFGKITVVGQKACATVNAKNAMGGYSGAQQAALRQVDGQWVFLDTLQGASHDDCVKFWIKDEN